MTKSRITVQEVVQNRDVESSMFVILLNSCPGLVSQIANVPTSGNLISARGHFLSDTVQFCKVFSLLKDGG